ncbi:conserved hypothetical protein [Ricinus communis]|uniref:Uncharacterized protein n=1 Tax=Ricinus communis TaxID=3988 RepID=B9STV2_RICCO|nr:conserved hypothetical protein [Ricinus communis]
MKLLALAVAVFMIATCLAENKKILAVAREERYLWSDRRLVDVQNEADRHPDESIAHHEIPREKFEKQYGTGGMIKQGE